jgi:hypothetical protein
LEEQSSRGEEIVFSEGIREVEEEIPSLAATKQAVEIVFSEGAREVEEETPSLAVLKELLACLDKTLRVVIYIQIKEVGTISQIQWLGAHQPNSAK